jgi:predicted RNA binding protein YcfA (HicA-like mRNA interferase family)
MSRWKSARARHVRATLQSLGWMIKRQGRGSHRVLARDGWPNYVFAFHENEEIGPKMLARIASHTGLTPEGL